MTPIIRRVGLVLVVAFALVRGAGAEPPKPVAVPPADDIKGAVETLKDVFEKDYALAETSAEGKLALARKLFGLAPQRKTAGMIFACHDEARRLAARAGDAKTALAAAEAIHARFTGVPATLMAETFVLLGKSDLKAEGAEALAPLARAAAAAALDREDYAAAAELAGVAQEAAKKAGDPDLALELRGFRARIDALGKAAATLGTKPDDPEANGVLGSYWVFDRGNWSAGLKHLAKGQDKALAEAAARDLAAPKTAKERTARGDVWHKLSKTAEGDRRRLLAERAWEWYSAAVAVATGDDDLKPGERAREIEQVYPALFNRTMEGHTAAVAAVAVTPDGKTVVSVGNDGAVLVWDAATGALRKSLDGHTGWVGSVVISPDGTRAYTAGGENSAGGGNVIRVWDLTALRAAGTLEGHGVAVRGLALTADGKLLVSGGGDKTVKLWDLAAGKVVRKYGPETHSVESVAVSADGSRVLAGTDNGVVTAFDAKTGEVVSKFDRHGGTIVYAVAVTRDGKTAVSGARDKAIRVWDVATGKELRVLAGHTEQVYQVALSADEKQLLSASFDKTVRIWDFAGGKELKRFEGHAEGVQGACYGPDGRTVFSAGWDKTVRKWRVPPGLAAPTGKKGN
jgi:WD40 repeat protein